MWLIRIAIIAVFRVDAFVLLLLYRYLYIAINVNCDYNFLRQSAGGVVGTPSTMSVGRMTIQCTIYAWDNEWPRVTYGPPMGLLPQNFAVQGIAQVGRSPLQRV